MLVRIQDSAGTPAVQLLLGWLRSWSDPESPRGVATVNVNLSEAGVRLDTIVWTPVGCVVIEARNFSVPGGDVTIPMHGPWLLEGEPLHFEDDTTPLDSSRDHTLLMQNWLAGNGIGQRAVHGVVLLVPPVGTSVHLHQQGSDPNLAVLLGDSETRLRGYLRQLPAAGTEVWTATDVALAFRALGLGAALPSPQELLNEGFLGPVDMSLWQERQSIPATPALATTPTVPLDAPWEETRLPYSPWTLYPKVPGETNFGITFLRLILTLGMLVSVAWILWFTVTVLTSAI